MARSPFSPDSFLLHNELARTLYQEIAATMPIRDSLTLLPPMRPQTDLSPLISQWLGADPRLNLALQRQGVLLSEAADAEAAFQQWGESLWRMAGSAWYLEAQLALHHGFGVEEWLSPDTLPSIWSKVQERLSADTWRSAVIPSPIAQLHSSLEPAMSLPDGFSSLQVLGAEAIHPAFGPDAILALSHPGRWNNYLDRLQAQTSSRLDHFLDLVNILQLLVDQWSKAGCRVAIHHLSDPGGVSYTDEEINFLFHKLRLRHPLDLVEERKLRSALLYHLLSMYHEQAWILHLTLGVHPADEGALVSHLLDDQPLLRNLFWQLDRWDQSGVLPRLILNLPGRPDLITHLMGHYPKQQMRPGLDLTLPQTPANLHHQLDAFLAGGLLMDGIGISSGASHPFALLRHDYGRRVFCNWLALQVSAGHLPHDQTWLEQVVRIWSGQGLQEWLG